jgi:hypothetical protein
MDTIYTGSHGGMGHAKIETRVLDERFEGMMCVCVTWNLQVRIS